MSATEWVQAAPHRLRERASRDLRRIIGLTQEPPEPCNDPAEAYVAVDSVARLVHGDLASMLVGGLGSLFFEMLHPHSMAGVAQHSRYQDDALGRILRTANFLGATTYGSRANAHAAIERVRAIHEGVRGVADDGVDYRASDPHLLAWVHDAGTSMFLRAYQRFGALPLSTVQADAYVQARVEVARDLGAENPPITVRELDEALSGFRPELRLSADGVVARDFVMHGVVRGATQRAVYRLLVDSALSLLEPWALDLLGVSARPVLGPLVLRPSTRAVGSLIRLAVPPFTPATSQ
ncbi:MAG TPA: oxygenase MpaB family protein [Acidimicrobiales bacterium]|nr:oxygenase MpaB family protein [Acidimicrobiales bacterium]